MPGFLLFLFFVNSVLLCDWIELLEFKLSVSELLLILSCVVCVTLTNTLRISLRYKLY